MSAHVKPGFDARGKGHEGGGSVDDMDHFLHSCDSGDDNCDSADEAKMHSGASFGEEPIIADFL